MATVDEETQHLLALYGSDAKALMALLQTQFALLANRSQTLLSLAAVTITVTGFSGANIARTGVAGAALIVSGLTFVLSSAVFALVGILRLEWITNTPPIALEAAVRLALERRERKTRAFRVAMVLLIVGLALYVSSISLLLLRNAIP